MTGRPSKLTNPETRERLLKAIAEGATLAVACEAAGISAATCQEWIRRGEGRDDRKATAEYAGFAQEIRKAIADSQIVLLTRVNAASKTDWKAAAWILERRFPEEWAVTNKIELAAKQQVSELLNGVAELMPEQSYKDLLEAIVQL